MRLRLLQAMSERIGWGLRAMMSSAGRTVASAGRWRCFGRTGEALDDAHPVSGRVAADREGRVGDVAGLRDDLAEGDGVALDRIAVGRLPLPGLAERRIEADRGHDRGRGEAAIAVSPAEGAHADLGDVAQPWRRRRPLDA